MLMSDISRFVVGILFLIFFLGCIGGGKMDLRGKKVLMVIAPENFRDEEFMKPKEILEGSGAEITVASKGVKEATGMFGAKANVDLDISEVNVDDYDAVIFVGGTGSSIYFDDSVTISIAKNAYEKGKVVAAICIAPSILANAGVLEGKNATSWPSQKENIEAKGGKYTGELVTVDGKIVTGRGPDAAEEFGRRIAEILSQ